MHAYLTPVRQTVSTLVEEAAKRLDPDETVDGYAEEQTVTFVEALAVLGPEIRARVTHAFGDKSLEELAVRHRTDMAGLQVSEVLRQWWLWFCGEVRPRAHVSWLL